MQGIKTASAGEGSSAEVGEDEDEALGVPAGEENIGVTPYN